MVLTRLSTSRSSRCKGLEPDCLRFFTSCKRAGVLARFWRVRLSSSISIDLLLWWVGQRPRICARSRPPTLSHLRIPRTPSHLRIPRTPSHLRIPLTAAHLRKPPTRSRRLWVASLGRGTAGPPSRWGSLRLGMLKRLDGGGDLLPITFGILGVGLVLARVGEGHPVKED